MSFVLKLRDFSGVYQIWFQMNRFSDIFVKFKILQQLRLSTDLLCNNFIKISHLEMAKKI